MYRWEHRHPNRHVARVSRRAPRLEDAIRQCETHAALPLRWRPDPHGVWIGTPARLRGEYRVAPVFLRAAHPHVAAPLRRAATPSDAPVPTSLPSGLDARP